MKKLFHISVFYPAHRSQIIIERQSVGTAQQHRRRRIDITVVIKTQCIAHHKRERKITVIEQGTFGPAISTIHQRREAYLIVIGKGKGGIIGSG